MPTCPRPAQSINKHRQLGKYELNVVATQVLGGEGLDLINHSAVALPGLQPELKLR